MVTNSSTNETIIQQLGMLTSPLLIQMFLALCVDNPICGGVEDIL